MFLIEASVHILAVRVYILFVRGLFFNGCVILSGAYYGSDVLNHLNIACAHMLHHNALQLKREGRGHKMHRGKVTFYMFKRVQTISLTPNQHSNITVSVQTDDLTRQLLILGNLFEFYFSHLQALGCPHQ